MKRKLLTVLSGIGLLSTLLVACGNEPTTPASSVGNSQESGVGLPSTPSSTDSYEYTDTEGTDGLVYELNSTQDGYIVTECLTIETDIKIPELYYNLPVREIGEAAFRYATIDSLSLPKSLRVIHKEAFMGISSESAITEIVIPEGVKEIGEESFYWCPTVKEITLPSTLKTIGRKAFGLSANLSKFRIENSPYFAVENGILFTADKKELVCYPEDLKFTTYDIPNSVEKIRASAFYGANTLTGITTGTNLIEVEDRAFAALFNLTQINFTKSKNLQILGDRALSENNQLALVTIPSTVTSMGVGLFDGNTALMTVRFKNTFTEIPDEFFNECSHLKNITIPDGVTRIGASAFDSCNSLETLILPETVTEIGERAFRACAKLKNFTLPSGITRIEDATFDCCRQLPNLTIPSGVTYIGERAFSDCDLFDNIDLSATKVETIADAAFMFCEAVKSITFPDTLKTIGENAFNGLPLIESLNFNDGLESIGDSAFYGWKKLAKVFIPASVKTIGGAAFISKAQEKVTLYMYFEADSFGGINYTSADDENIFFGVTRAEYEAL